jgi:hypothetical protein
MILLLSICFIVWIIANVVPLPPPWLQVTGLVLVLVILLSLLGVVHVGRP